ncbi:alpha/beta hydrolase [Burkholderia contaminans]|uniref:alpha/beta hydrolase n=1 Tax=Burkholderia contaminans TaxID=488447 RepID=UPI000F5B506B|nr:alpha/beta hydrolase [Burkholderia contaminans]RQT19119.1 alpha/beta hydrolase [Burkholderia contaminans]
MNQKGIRYVHSAPPSQESRDFQALLYEQNGKTLFTSAVAGTVNKSLLKQLAGMEDILTAAPIPDSLLQLCELNTQSIQGRAVWTLMPRAGASGKLIFYIHGGGYVINITNAHWQYLEQLCRATGATLVVPDYPLAPAATFTETYTFIEAAYNMATAHVDPAQISIVGDSAGGGLTLGFAQKRRNEGRSLPKRIVVLSPWLDATLTNMDIDAIDDRDHLLGTRGLVRSGLAYAGGHDPRDYRISPIYGRFDGLPPLAIFQGTHDIFAADTRKLVAQMEHAGIEVDYFEFPGQCHVWAIFPLPESQVAIEKIAELVRKE